MSLAPGTRLGPHGLIAVTAILVHTLIAAAGVPAESPLVGTWRGTSTCVDKGTACRDEVAVYRITAAPGKTDTFLVDGGKVVAGKDVSMSVLEGRFDANTRTLTMTPPQGTIVLELAGDTLTGTYMRPNKQVLRRISLKKDVSAAPVRPQ